MPADMRARAMTGPEQPDWADRTERLLDAALYALRSGEDPLPLMSAAETAFRVGAGDLPDGAMDGYPFPGEDGGAECACPPGLKARGGFTSSCLACATVGGA